MSATHVRRFNCGHEELVSPDSPRFPWCHQCGENGVDDEFLKCSMPTCTNAATRVVRYSQPDGVALHYCDDCLAAGEMHDDRVIDRRRL